MSKKGRAARLAITSLTICIAGGCTSPPQAPEAPQTEGAQPAEAPESQPLGEGRELTAEQAALRSLEQLGLIIYFDFDNADIRPEYRQAIAANARFLGDFTSRRLRLEGHADERGTREYNVGLGERRAQAVRRALMLQGASDSQLTTVSYGEERPVVSDSGEEAWSKNRRVELRYAP